MEILIKLRNLLYKDSIPYGVVLGFVFPVAAFFLYYLIKYYPHEQSIQDYLTLFIHNPKTVPAVISLCLIANGIIFYWFTQQQRDLTAKGILLITLLYGLLILLLKLH